MAPLELSWIDGDELLVPKQIRKLILSRIIAQCLTICEETDFNPASPRTLLRILEVCPASTRKSLHGLENYTANWYEELENLEEVVDKLYDAGLCRQRLRLMALSCKRYLKQDYSKHVVNDPSRESTSVSTDHCRYFALRDPKKEEFRQCCEHSHSIECDRCEERRILFDSLDKAMQSVFKGATVSDERNDLQFLLDDSKDKIEQWKSNILRSVNQDEERRTFW